MYTDPRDTVLTTKMISSFTAEVVNELINPLEIKTIIILFIFIFGLIFVCNCSLSYSAWKRAPKDYEDLSPRFTRKKLLNESNNKMVKGISENSCGDCLNSKKRVRNRSEHFRSMSPAQH